MRISDWSSDVCSSDQMVRVSVIGLRETRPLIGRKFEAEKASAIAQHAVRFLQRGGNVGDVADTEGDRIGVENLVGRSEEHTSELQSLMRNSYAVFCLKKKNNNQVTTYITSTRLHSTIHNT